MNQCRESFLHNRKYDETSIYYDDVMQTFVKPFFIFVICAGVGVTQAVNVQHAREWLHWSESSVVCILNYTFKNNNMNHQNIKTMDNYDFGL